jgi:hypothetical protein
MPFNEDDWGVEITSSSTVRYNKYTVVLSKTGSVSKVGALGRASSGRTGVALQEQDTPKIGAMIDIFDSELASLLGAFS